MKLSQVLWNKNRPYILHPSGRKRRYGRIIVCATCGEKCFIKTEEVIHHIDKNKTNNRIENLLITDNVEHKKLHARS